MQTTVLADMTARYTWLEFIDFGAGGQYLGTLEGTLTGERLSGSLRMVNIPPKRPDDVNVPTLRGALTTGDGAKIFLEMNGVALLRPADQARVFTTSVVFRTGDARYAWLNNAFGVQEGVLLSPESIRARIHLCENTIAAAR
jgi:hypothetical protein